MNKNQSGSKAYLFSIVLVAVLGGLLFGYDTAVISGAEKGLQAFFHAIGGGQSHLLQREHALVVQVAQVVGVDELEVDELDQRRDKRGVKERSQDECERLAIADVPAAFLVAEPGREAVSGGHDDRHDRVGEQAGNGVLWHGKQKVDGEQHSQCQSAPHGGREDVALHNDFN